MNQIVTLWLLALTVLILGIIFSLTTPTMIGLASIFIGFSIILAAKVIQESS